MFGKALVEVGFAMFLGLAILIGVVGLIGHVFGTDAATSALIVVMSWVIGRSLVAFWNELEDIR
jgi:hypothetical protein